MKEEVFLRDNTNNFLSILNYGDSGDVVAGHDLSEPGNLDHWLHGRVGVEPRITPA